MLQDLDTTSATTGNETDVNQTVVPGETINTFEADRVEALALGFNKNLLVAIGIGGLTDEIARRIVAQVEDLKIAVFKGKHGDYYVKDSDIDPTVIDKVTAAILPPRESKESLSSVTRRRTK